MERILVLVAAQTCAEADRMLRGARDSAAAPSRLSFGLSLAQEPGPEDMEAMRRLGCAQFVAPGRGTWADMPALWQGEGYVLAGHPALRFTRHWDIALLRSLRQCSREDPPRAVLTGYLPRPEDIVDAVSPVAAESFDAEGRLCFHRGTPLRYARAPQRSAFLHPDFCFGPAAFFRDLAQAAPPLFLAAFREKWDLYTLNRALLHMAWDEPLPPCGMPEEDGRETGLERFEKRFGLKAATRQLSAMARLGVFTADLTFPLRVPLAVRVQEAAAQFAARSSKVSPLCVTAFLTLPVPGESLPEESMCRFARLSSLRNLALLCFADGESARRISAIHPNVLEYKRRYGLPLRGEVPPAEGLNYLRLSKPFLLAQSREKFSGHTHYVWLDFGYLRYPVYERASLSWDGLCGEKIVLATVEGVPDASMVVVPRDLLERLCRECASLCEENLRLTGALPGETEVWTTLLRSRPAWFAPVELPGKRELLSLTMLSREEEFHVLA